MLKMFQKPAVREQLPASRGEAFQTKLFKGRFPDVTSVPLVSDV